MDVVETEYSDKQRLGFGLREIVTQRAGGYCSFFGRRNGLTFSSFRRLTRLFVRLLSSRSRQVTDAALVRINLFELS